MTRSKLRKFHGALLGSIALAILITGSAAAHLNLARSIPGDGDILGSSPDIVQLWFNEELDTFESEVSVFDSINIQVDLGDSCVDPEDRRELSVGLPNSLSPGEYTAVWIAVDDNDSHPISGEIEFTIKANPQQNSQLTISWPAIFLFVLSLMGIVILLVANARRQKRED